MITILRRNQRGLMLVVAILTIIAFACLYNPATTRNIGANTVAKIYGQGLSQADIEREARNYRLSLVMGQYALIQALGGMDRDDERGFQNFIWNLFVLRHESDRLGIVPTDEQIADLLRKLPVFQKDGQFSKSKYDAFVKEQLFPSGFTEEQLNSVASDALRLERLKNVISAPVGVGDAELDEALRAFQKVDLQIVHFPVAKDKPATVTEDEIRATYEKQKAEFVSPETRAVKYVEFTVPPAAAAATGKEKVDAMQKAADLADAFTQKIGSSGTGFEDAAKADGLAIKETPEFDRTGGASNLAKEKPEDLKNIAASAFLLGQDAADVVPGTDKYFVVKLVKITPERQLSLDEARPYLQNALQQQKAAEQATVEAQTVLAKLRDAVAGGQSLADAAKANGLTVDVLTGVDPTKLKPEDKLTAEAANLSTLMNPAELSGLIPTPSGPIAVYLAARAPLALSADELAKQKSAITQELTEGKRRLLFTSWLLAENTAANITVVQRRER